MIDPHDLPAPTSDRHISERRYKKVVGIVHHNAPIDTTHIQIKFVRSYHSRKLGPLLNQAVRNGHLRRLDSGAYVTTDAVR
ncbi:hypothetical protein OSG_eHP18_00135 [environmental Halophage eHP-18]|nr:hypothetical protein OSG_eHP17_00045 [environmental Halophage eHP-17]AFH22184.1 hypothetical protein OSG_eHP18_00135 [environmental Halophage eHP-18]AFH22712.1 hypothetical protein OSG_eHP33_00045 [environmental Halophage eHP-33]